MNLWNVYILGLRKLTEYEFTVRGINNLGEGDFSNEIARAKTSCEFFFVNMDFFYIVYYHLVGSPM